MNARISCKALACTALFLTLVACGNMNDRLERMIPADATGAISIDVPQLVDKAGIRKDDRIVIPAELESILDANDRSRLCQIITDLPVSGINTDCRAFVYFSGKTFNTVALVALDDPDAMRTLLSRRTGADFATVENVDCIYRGDYLYAIDGKVLLAGHVARAIDQKKAARAARSILDHNARSLLDDKQARQCLHADQAINAYLQLKGLKTLLRKSDAYKEIAQRMPLLEIFTESDIESVDAHVTLDDTQATLNAAINAQPNSEYVQLLNATLSKPADVTLKAIPNSMDYIVSMSVNGQNFVKLQQLQQLIDIFKKLPYIGRIDLASILATIDGPFTVGMARDPHLEGEWNVVVAARTNNADTILQQISSFANSMGQAPELYDNEYIYQYENKMIKMGMIDDVLYLKMLDYEQTEGYASEMTRLNKFFASAPIAIYGHTRNDSTNCYIDFGLTDNVTGIGHFYTDRAGANVTLELLKSLCSVKPDNDYDTAEDDMEQLIGLDN